MIDGGEGMRSAGVISGPTKSGSGIGWDHLVLVGLVLLSVVGSIQAARWVDGLIILPWASVAGLLTGALLARASWPGRYAHATALLVAGPFLALLLSGQLEPGLEWRARLVELQARFSQWLAIASGGGESHDALIFLAAMAVLVWWLGYAMGWAIFRRASAWWAVVLAALPLTINRYYGPSALDQYLVLFIVFSLLLVIRVELHRRQRGWQRARLRFDPSQGWDYLRDGLLFSLLALFLAWWAPLLPSDVSAAGESYTEIVRRPWQAIQAEVDRLFHALRGYRSEGFLAFYGERHDLRGGIDLKGDVIMRVRAKGGRYWRAMVYHTYDGRGWSNTDEQFALAEAGDPLPREGEYNMRQTLQQAIALAVPSGGQLFAASQPVEFDRPVEARLSFIDSPQNSQAAVTAINTRPPLGPGDSYQVLSSLTIADFQSLRGAGTEYPDWVRQRYLQLPQKLPQRVVDLASRITADSDNPYDKAAALESYLRRIVYNERIPNPPPGRDLVDWFLFDLRQGYCDYYASAMVVMARSMGIPARVAVGFARGEYDPAEGIYTVRAWDAHTWVEIYFPGYGWVEFEPTAAEPSIDRPLPRPLQDLTGGGQPGGELTEPRFREQEFLEDEGIPVLAGQSGGNDFRLVVLGFLLAFPFAGGLLWWLALAREVSGLPPAERAYRSMVFYARKMGVVPRGSQTPLEYASTVSRALPEASEEIARIADLFAAERFQLGGLAEVDIVNIERAWSRLRWALWRGILDRAISFVRAPLLQAFEPLYRSARRLLG